MFENVVFTQMCSCIRWFQDRVCGLLDAADWVQIQIGMGKVMQATDGFRRAMGPTQGRTLPLTDTGRITGRMSHRMSHEPDPCPAAAQRRIVRNRSVKPGHPDQVFDQPDRLPQRKGASCFQDEAGPARSSRDPGPENGTGGVQIIQYEDRVREVAGVATLITQIISNGTPAVDILLLKQSKAFRISLYDAPKVIPTKSYYTETELRNCEAQRASALLRLDAQGRRLGNPFSAHRAHAS